MNLDAPSQFPLGVAVLPVHGRNHLGYGPPPLEDCHDLAGGMDLIENRQTPGLEIGFVNGLNM